ncbi:hypothetical protein TNCV_2961551 [Trichonephila clavipes]|nr:hypothetical protein TNCV_2961551 [Trichonephila clavipes]
MQTISIIAQTHITGDSNATRKHCIRGEEIGDLKYAPLIQSVKHHSVSARTIRRRLQQSGMSARRPLLRLPLTKATGVCATNGAINGCHGQWNGTTLCLLKNPASGFNISMVGFEFGYTVGRGC